MNSLQGWLPIIFVVIVNIVSITIAWQKNSGRINGMGKRVRDLESHMDRHAGRVQQISDEQGSIRGSNASVHERLGSVEQQYKALSEKLTDIQVNLAGHLGEIKTMIASSQSQTGERLAKVEANIEYINKHRG